MSGRGKDTYQRIRRVGDFSERFWSKVGKLGDDECWLWRGATKEHGYGVIQRGRRGEMLVKAHVAAYTLTVGDVPKGMCVRHRCDNPGCCNPSHLLIGTHAENMDDMARRRRRVIHSDAALRVALELVSAGVPQRKAAGAVGASRGLIMGHRQGKTRVYLNDGFS